tara:strand:- start:96 stop:494 length:399 start_codon:yes stop_codon:yes gene_type:complete
MLKTKLLLPILFITIFSCTKTEGPGGQATIKGKVSIANTNVLGTIIDTYDAQEKNVYINYGDVDNTFDDDIKTSHDGTFEFNYLNKGNYEIFLYSDCISCPKGQDSLIKIDVTVDSRAEVLDLGTITIANFI